MTCREAILAATRAITRRKGKPEFSIQEVIAELRASGSPYPDSTIRTHMTSLMCVGAPRHHAVRHDDLVRVARGVYLLASDTGGSQAGTGQKARGRQGKRPLTGSVSARVDRLIADFSSYVDAFDRTPAFIRPDQLRLHRETIRRRRLLGSVCAAIDDDAFLDLLRATLVAWGIGVRRSRLAEPVTFRKAVRRQRTAIASLDERAIDDANLEIAGTSNILWEVIGGLGIVDNQAPLVAGSKTLHHLLPDLVVPIDREYTQRFFGWWSPQFQYQQQRFFGFAFQSFAAVGRAVHPQQYIGPVWRTSRTKVIDNAIVAFCRLEDAPPDGN